MSVLINLNKAGKIGRDLASFRILKVLALVLACLIIAGAALPVASFAADKTTLVSPANNATNVNNVNVVFTWQKVSDNVTYYKFDIASDAALNNLFVTEYIDAPAVTYTVTKTMTFGVKYYWRVTAVLPNDQVGDPSDVWSFTVRSEGTPAQTTTPATTPSTTTPAGGTPATTSSTGGNGGGIMGFIDEIGWPLTLGMVGIVVIFIILLSILLTKPKKSPAGMGTGAGGGMGGMGMGGRMGPQQQRSQQGPGMTCPTCGLMNTPDRKFCANCGTVMGAGQQFQAPPFQQQQQQYPGMPYQAENQAPPFRPPQPPPFQGQQFQGQQYQPPFQGQPFQGQPFGQQYGQGPASRMQQQGGVCSTCGAANPPGRQFCGNCGATLMQAQQQQRFQTQPVFCPNCGAPAQPGQQWCGNCGGNLPVGGGQQHVVGTYQSFSCPICGANINRGLNPCPSCGTWLDWGR